MKQHYAFTTPALLLLLTACGGGESSEPSVTPPIVPPPVTQPPAETAAPTIATIAPFTEWNEQAITLSANVTLDPSVTATYQWQQTAGAEVILSGADKQTVIIDASQLENDTAITLKLTVTDSNNKTASTLVNINLNDRISAAMKTGNASDINGPLVTSLIKRLDKDFIHSQQLQSDFLNTIFSTDAIAFEPGQHSQLIEINNAIHGYPNNPTFELLKGNQGRILAAATAQQGVNHAAFGTDIFNRLNAGHFPEFEASFKRLLAWQMQQTLTDASTNRISIFGLNDSGASRVKTWFASQYPNMTVTHCADSSATDETLTTCVNDSDLVVVASDEVFTDLQINSVLDSALSQKKPLLYTHRHSWNSKPQTSIVLGKIHFSMQVPGGPGNFFSNDKANWNTVADMQQASPLFSDEQKWVKGFLQQEFPFNFSLCQTECEALYSDNYRPSLQAIKQRINQLDQHKVTLFEQPDSHAIYKKLVLLGDIYRQEINYPMNVASLDNLSFAKAYFADHSVFYTRSFSMVPHSLGNFSRTDFSHVTPKDKQVSITSKSGFRSAGVYHIPGKPMSITRSDNNAVRTWIFINTQRSASTKEFGENSYNRPKYLQSPQIELKKGETVTLNSAYGGPVQVRFDQSDINTQFSFSNIGEHPYWRDGLDANTFATALAQADYDWAEIASPHFEVHSQTDKMQQTMTLYSRWNTADTMAEAMNNNLHNLPHVLAGFQGPNIDTVAEIVDFASSHNLTVAQLNTVKHMNADQATCGSGCSGNPYDAFWNFNPLGHGDIHELGHGLEHSKLRFDGVDGHASTNPYSYYTKYMNYLSLGELPNCQSLPIKNEFDLLQQSAQTADPFTFMKAANLNGWSQGMSIMVQMYATAQKQGAVSNGWHLLPRLHIILREFEANKNDLNKWDAIKTQLGFSLFDQTEAKSISNNDFLAIAMSYATKLNYLPLFDMWGLTVSDKAKLQVAQFGYTATIKQVFAFEKDGYCYGLDLPVVAIDGVQTWPFN